MDKQWVGNKTAEYNKKIEQLKVHVVEGITQCTLIPEDKKPTVLAHVDSYENEPYGTTHSMMIVLLNVMADVDVEIEWFDDFIYKKLKLEDYIMALRYRYFGHLLDSEPMEFEGDIIITDPCYLVKKRDASTAPDLDDFLSKDYSNMSAREKKDAGYHEDVKRYREAYGKWDEENPDDWEKCDCGYNMKNIGIEHCMTRSTLYGDWGCSTYNSDTKEKLGHFTADAGQVGVFILNEVLSYNPSYRDYMDNLYCVTVLRDFKGTVQFVVTQDDPAYNDFSVRVVGKGINTKTGAPYNFITSQTSL